MLVFVPMTEKNYQSYAGRGIKSYARENVRAGRWQASEAEARAEEVFQSLLPEGLATRDHYFFNLLDPGGGKTVGHVWYGIRTQDTERTVSLYDIEIFEEFRRKGYATQAMRALEARAREINASRISLDVFGHNRAARALYEKLGYDVTSLQMAKELIPAGDEKERLPDRSPAGPDQPVERVRER